MSTPTLDTEELIRTALGGLHTGLESAIGYELVARGLRLLLWRDLNAELEAEEAKHLAADSALQELGMDPGVPAQIELDRFGAANLHEGPHESLMNREVSAFPNISIMSYLSAPAGSQFDQFDTSDITVFVEPIVIAGPVPTGGETAYETIVHRKIQRTHEAVHRVVQHSGNVLGTVLPIQEPPLGGIASSSWLRSEKGGAGPRYLIQGSRLQYTMQRNHRSL